jgi:hypothetical protein
MGNKWPKGLSILNMILNMISVHCGVMIVSSLQSYLACTKNKK